MSEAFDKIMSGLREMQEHIEASRRRQVEEIAALSRIHGIPIYRSSNLAPFGVSLLIGEKLWDEIQKNWPSDRDGARQRGDANAAPVPQDRQARAEGIAQKDQSHD